MRNADDFVRELEQARKKPDPDFGGVVFPAARVFSTVAADAELSAFKEAMQRLLASQDGTTRDWAVSVCVGFVYFANNIEPPSFARLQVIAPPDASDDAGSVRDERYFVEALSGYATAHGRAEDAIRLHAKASAGAEAMAFLDAVEQLVASKDEALRRYGIEVCTEFVLRQVSPPQGEPEGPTEFVVHSREPFRLNRNFKLRARKIVAIHLPRAILSPEGTPLSDIVQLSNQDATVGLLEAKPGGGVASIVFELAPGDEISLTRSAEAVADDGTEGGVIVFDAQAA
jgi:hypothetical protein